MLGANKVSEHFEQRAVRMGRVVQVRSLLNRAVDEGGADHEESILPQAAVDGTRLLTPFTMSPQGLSALLTAARG